MQLLRNSVWKCLNDSELENGRYRVLTVYAKSNLAILYYLDNEDRLCKPIATDITLLTTLYRNKEWKLNEYQIPAYMQNEDVDLQDAWIKKRDDNYLLIKALVESPNFVVDFATRHSSTELKDTVRRSGKTRTVICRLLDKYWRFGQIPNALLPAYANSGGAGKQRAVKESKRGRPVAKSKFGFDFNQGINITESDKDKIYKGLKKFYLTDSDIGLERARKKTIEAYYAEELKLAVLENRSAQVPSYRQFCYWKKKLLDPVDSDRKKMGLKNWNLEGRGLTSSVSANVKTPGFRYEIDSTQADVYLVSNLNRNTILGKATIYVITDQASRMITGIHVSHQNASWEAARQALMNAFLPKVEFCARYGVDIDASEWPCSQVPMNLLCDRGEMIGEKPKILTKGLGTNIEINPPYRADWKPIVERKFGIANKEGIHDLPGSTKGRSRKRGEKDPRLEAAITIGELTKTLLTLFIEFNKTRQFADLADKLLIGNDLAPTPINYWRAYTEQQRHSLHTVSKDQLIALLLPKKVATVTRQGIVCGGIKYICKQASQDNWFARARLHGRWSIEARVDEICSDYIFIRPDNNSHFIKCELLDTDKIYSGLAIVEAEYRAEWLRSKGETPDRLASDSKVISLTNEIVKTAKAKKKEHPKPNTKSGSIRNINENKKKAIREERSKLNLAQSEILSPSAEKKGHKKVKKIDPKILDLLRQSESTDE